MLAILPGGLQPRSWLEGSQLKEGVCDYAQMRPSCAPHVGISPIASVCVFHKEVRLGFWHEASTAYEHLRSSVQSRRAGMVYWRELNCLNCLARGAWTSLVSFRVYCRFVPIILGKHTAGLWQRCWHKGSVL